MTEAIADVLRGLDRLYTVTGHDWTLTVSHILTEPTCPFAEIKPEAKGTGYRPYCFFADTVEEAIKLAADAVRRDVLKEEEETT